MNWNHRWGLVGSLGALGTAVCYAAWRNAGILFGPRPGPGPTSPLGGFHLGPGAGIVHGDGAVRYTNAHLVFGLVSAPGLGLLALGAVPAVSGLRGDPRVATLLEALLSTAKN
ncbi:MAG: hypothetical protein ABEJ42_10645 [Halobacteriaceae archaeon]